MTDKGLTPHKTHYQKAKQHNQKMGRRPGQTFSQRTHTDEQQAYEKVFNIANH